MATGIAQSTAAGTKGLEDQQRLDFIRRQLTRARRKVYWVEMTAALLQLVGLWLLTIFVFVLADHWLWPLADWLRWAVFTILTGLTAWLAVTRLGPLLVWSIHPFYVAKQVEEAEPELKNSLLNFLFLRRQPSQVPRPVLEVVERAAADNLHRVPVDDCIDRTPVVRWLSAVAIVVALAGLYQIVSPKSPWRSAERILMPWRSTAAPSRVEILKLEPGSVEVPYESRVTVHVEARGVRADDRAILRWTTADGSVLDKELPLNADKDRLHFTATLPPGAEGLRQSVAYRVSIGDAHSETFQVTVLPKPVISVQRLEYVFPSYMQRAPVRVEGQGDIEAPEGTQVTLWARANLGIREAYLDWEPDASGQPTAGYKLMQHEGQLARTTFVLQWDAQRQSPWHTHYQVRYVAVNGRSSQQATVHQIRVIPDLAPVVDILAPTKRPLEVPLNGRVVVEVRAVDPDFGLTYVGLEGSTSAGTAWNTSLLPDSVDAFGWRGQFSTKLTVRPQDQGWQVGEVVVFRAVARDNRHDIHGNPAPNQSTSLEYTLLVTEPVEPPKSPSQQATQQSGAQDGASPPDEAARSEQANPNAASQQPSDSSNQQAAPGAPQESTPDMKSANPDNQRQGGAMPQEQPASTTPPNARSGASQPGSQKTDDSGNKTTAPQQTPSEPGTPSAQDGQQNGSPTSGQSPGASPTGQKSEQSQRDSGAVSAPSKAGREQASKSSPRSPADATPDNANLKGVPTSGQGTVGPGTAKSPAENTPTTSGSGDAAQPGLTPSAQPASGQTPSQEQPSGQSPSGQSPSGQSPSGQSPSVAGRSPDTARDRAPDGTSETGEAGGQPAASPDATAPQGTPSEQPSGSRLNGGSQASDEGDAPESSPAPNKDLHDGDVFEIVRRYLEQQGKWPGDQLSHGEDGSKHSMQRPQPQAPGATPEEHKEDMHGNTAPDKRQPAEGRRQDQPSSGSSRSDIPSGDRPEASRPDVQTPSADNKLDGASAQPNAQSPSGEPSGSSERGEASSDRQRRGGEAARTGATSGSDAGDAPSPSTPQSQSVRRPGGGLIGGVPPGQGTVPGTPRPQPDASVEPNLEYARKATDLVLEYLRDQQHRADPALLNRLGWNADQLAEFLRRWEQLKQAAEQDPRQRQELDEALKSLGLRPPDDRVRQSRASQQGRSQQAESAERSSPPAKYLELFNAFRKGAARATEEPPPSP